MSALQITIANSYGKIRVLELLLERIVFHNVLEGVAKRPGEEVVQKCCRPHDKDLPRRNMASFNPQVRKVIYAEAMLKALRFGGPGKIE